MTGCEKVTSLLMVFAKATPFAMKPIRTNILNRFTNLIIPILPLFLCSRSASRKAGQAQSSPRQCFCNWLATSADQDLRRLLLVSLAAFMRLVDCDDQMLTPGHISSLLPCQPLSVSVNEVDNCFSSSSIGSMASVPDDQADHAAWSTNFIAASLLRCPAV